MTAVEIIAVDNATEARELTDQIKSHLEDIWPLVRKAYESRAWAALGYATWDDYCTHEFGASRIRLPREERQEVVASLRESGLSIRAIAAVTGASAMTIQNDLRAGVPDQHTSDEEKTPATTEWASPEEALADLVRLGNECRAKTTDRPAQVVPQQRVTGTDGKSYVASKPTVRPASKLRRGPLTDDARRASADLYRVINRIERIAKDDRFEANRDVIVTLLHGQLSTTAEILQKLLDDKIIDKNGTLQPFPKPQQ